MTQRPLPPAGGLKPRASPHPDWHVRFRVVARDVAFGAAYIACAGALVALALLVVLMSAFAAVTLPGIL